MSDAAQAAAATPAPAPIPVIVEPVLVEPVAPAAPAPEPAVVARPPEPEPTILGGEPPALEPAAAAEAPEPPAEPAPAPESVKEPEAAPEPPLAAVEPEPLVYEPFEFPEELGVTTGDPGLTKFVEWGTTHRIPQADMQELASLYSERAQEFSKQVAEQLERRQWDTFHETVRGWEAESREKFGNRFNTTIEEARLGLQELAGDEAAALRQVLTGSGLGNHPAVIAAFATAARRLREPTPPPRPSPTTARGVTNPADRRYGRMAEN